MKNILYVLAHFDDETFSSGTIIKQVREGHNVNVLIICGNGADLNDDRYSIFNTNMSLIKATGYSLKYFDLTLRDLKEDIKIEIKKSIEKFINNHQIDIVYTNHGGDLHSDHQVVSEMIRVVCRPYSNIEALYECYVPGAAEYGKGVNNFNTIVDITEIANLKSQCVLNYKNYLKNGSSHDTCMLQSQYIGSLYGFKYAEHFKMIWQKVKNETNKN